MKNKKYYIWAKKLKRQIVSYTKNGKIISYGTVSEHKLMKPQNMEYIRIDDINEEKLNELLEYVIRKYRIDLILSGSDYKQLIREIEYIKNK